MPIRRHSGSGSRSGPATSGSGAAAGRRARASEARQLRLHLGQPGRVPGHQDGVVLVGEVARLVLPVRVGRATPQEVALVGQVPALVARRIGPRALHCRRSVAPSPHWPPPPSARRTRGSGARRGRPRPPARRQPRTSGMIQMSGTPPASGGTKQDGLAVLGHEHLVDVGGRTGPAATMLSIWCRTAMAVVAFDWATERSVHDGQRTPASMAAARCAAVGGAVSKSAAADDQRHGQDDQRQGHPGPQRQAGRDAQPRDARACSAWAAARNESRFFCVAGPTSTAVTRPAGIDHEGRRRRRHPVAARRWPRRGRSTAGQRSPFVLQEAASPSTDVSWNTTLTMSAPSAACACS